MKVITTTITYLDGIEFEWLLTGYFSKYIPAKTSGRPEDCHPEEGGELEVSTCELHSISPNNIGALPSLIDEARPSDEEVDRLLKEAAFSSIYMQTLISDYDD